ncbi:hypothetical protein TREES_T100010473 [Tupaia chinensis]|uniref:Uncharacterized protein n=1 Tax=Tupaia chinensis TaxID=246437 RepID=L9LBK4_TUPCH|nr:hypothetical protein TREES_T100010473 [Tupaia chinensis]
MASSWHVCILCVARHPQCARAALGVCDWDLARARCSQGQAQAGATAVACAMSPPRNNRSSEVWLSSLAVPEGRLGPLKHAQTSSASLCALGLAARTSGDPLLYPPTRASACDVETCYCHTVGLFPDASLLSAELLTKRPCLSSQPRASEWDWKDSRG